MACSGLYPPYEHVLQEIIVTGEGDGALATIRVDPEKGRLHLAGGKQGLEILATNIEGFGEEEEIDHHQHIEYFPDHVYLAEGSDALILNLEDE